MVYMRFKPDISLRLALSILMWSGYGENSETEKDIELTIYRSQQCDTRSGIGAGKIMVLLEFIKKTIQYNTVYFQQRTQLHYNNNFYPTLGWLERGWIEE